MNKNNQPNDSNPTSLYDWLITASRTELYFFTLQCLAESTSSPEENRSGSYLFFQESLVSALIQALSMNQHREIPKQDIFPLSLDLTEEYCLPDTQHKSNPIHGHNAIENTCSKDDIFPLSLDLTEEFCLPDTQDESNLIQNQTNSSSSHKGSMRQDFSSTSSAPKQYISPLSLDSTKEYYLSSAKYQSNPMGFNYPDSSKMSKNLNKVVDQFTEAPKAKNKPKRRSNSQEKNPWIFSWSYKPTKKELQGLSYGENILDFGDNRALINKNSKSKSPHFFAKTHKEAILPEPSYLETKIAKIKK
ncbi:MAG: hypothetical protein LEGION0403_FIIPPAGN_02383 [Legionella sp.]|uniref:hypothetical protein n=1 Tax=Legionella sp. TaxID=459 RepID=UPI003D0C045B